MRFGDSAGIDSTTAYTTQRMYAENITPAAAISEGVDAAQFYPICSSVVNAAEYSTHILNIFDYRSTVKNVTWMMRAGGDSGATGGYMAFHGGIWIKPTLANPMTQFYISNNSFARGSEFTLYGIKDS